MSEWRTLARPYAKAIFEIAKDSGEYQRWSETLGFCASVAKDALMKTVFANAVLSNQTVADMFLAICEGRLSQQEANMIRVLAEARRLALLPEIACLFEAYREKAESQCHVLLQTPHTISAKDQESITQSLSKRLGREALVAFEKNPDVLGGYLAKAGYFVIDGTLQNRLEQLKQRLVT